MSLLYKVDYSNPFNMKRIERENMRIYRNLINIYTRKPQVVTLSKVHEYNQGEFVKSKCLVRFKQMKQIQDDNLRLFIRLLKTKPTPAYTLKECQKHWQMFLLFKSRKFINKNARIRASY